MVMIQFLFLFFVGNFYFFCINDNDKIIGVYVGSKGRFIFVLQNGGYFGSQMVEVLIFGINDVLFVVQVVDGW